MEGVFVSFIFSSHSLRFRAAHLGRFRYKENWERVCEKSAVLTEEIIFYEANLCQPFVKLIRQGQQICSPQCR